MDYINTLTREVVTLADVRQRLNASVPDGAEAGDYAPILPAEAPAAPSGSKVIATAPVEAEGQWFYGWAIVPLYATQAEEDATLAALKVEALTEVRSLRADFFPSLAGLQSEALARGNDADALAIAAVQQGARDITLTDLSACTTKAQIDTAFMTVWIGLVSQAPASVIRAFQGLKA